MISIIWKLYTKQYLEANKYFLNLWKEKYLTVQLFLEKDFSLQDDNFLKEYNQKLYSENRERTLFYKACANNFESPRNAPHENKNRSLETRLNEKRMCKKDFQQPVRVREHLKGSEL